MARSSKSATKQRSSKLKKEKHIIQKALKDCKNLKKTKLTKESIL